MGVAAFLHEIHTDSADVYAMVFVCDNGGLIVVICFMQIIPGGSYAYEYIIGCKTGYTNAARYCLVSCAEKDGMRLICVVMRDESPMQYEVFVS